VSSAVRFETCWVQDMGGDWFKFKIPVSLKTEISLLSVLNRNLDPLDAATRVVSEILDMPPPLVEEKFTAHQIFTIYSNVFSKEETEEVSQNLKTVQLGLETKGIRLDESIPGMLAFLSYYGGIPPSEALGLPRVIVVEILREVLELLETDKKMQFDLSAVNALSMAFGGSSGSSSSSSSIKGTKDNQTVDLTNIDNLDAKSLGAFKDFIEVK
jgi:hypothetical protein